MRYGNVEIKKQTQIFVTVSYYFRMQVIRYMETDKDHIHYMIETEPTMSISKIVNLMKSYTTYHIWKRYPDYLRNISGKNILFGRTDILSAVWEMYQKRCPENI